MATRGKQREFPSPANEENDGVIAEHQTVQPHTSESPSSSDVRSVPSNSGSVARDHLASERTFLAYVRTSLAFSSAGVALVQLFTIAAANSSSPTGRKIEQFARPLGAATVIIGISVLVLGGQRYFKTQFALVEGRFPVARKTIIFLTVLLTCLIAATFPILVAIPRTP